MKLALIADLHFGSVPDGLADELAAALAAEAPDVVVAAGDLTLRARSHEFHAAQNWLCGLPAPVLVVPGNHDLPFWNLFQRFADPFGRFCAATGANLMPVLEHGRAFILGFNTARSWQPHLRWQEGVARRADIAAARAALAGAHPEAFRIVAAHHPFLRPDCCRRARPVRRAGAALDAFAEKGVCMVLSGHTHQSFAVEAERAGKRIVFIGAPTALSWRRRGEENGFWLVDVGQEVRAVLHLRKGSRFGPVSEHIFDRERVAAE